MQYREYKKTGDKISLLGLGLMRLPHASGNEAKINYEEAKAVLDVCYKSGVNYFDTAYGYHGGNSEAFSCKALKDYPRESYFLASKLPMWVVETREDAERIFAEQLERTEAGYFDFYLFHALNKKRFATVQELGLWDFMQEKKKEGKIKNIGFSFHDTTEVLKEICEVYPWDFAQLQLNYVDWEMQDAKGQYETLEENGIPCIVMEPVRGGRLADLGPVGNKMLLEKSPGSSVASWAMRWVAQLPNVMCVLSGMSSIGQAQDNIETMSNPAPLTEDEQAVMQKAVEEFRSHALIPCTACQYCMPCPAGVQIPQMFSIYNECIFDGNNFGLYEKYNAVPEEGRASQCVSCGACESNCPQKIEISEELKKIIKRIEE